MTCKRCNLKADGTFFLTLNGRKLVVCEICFCESYRTAPGGRRHVALRSEYHEPPATVRATVTR